MAPANLHPKHANPLGKLGVWWMKNFGKGTAGIFRYSLGSWWTKEDFTQRNVHQVLWVMSNREKVMVLLRRIRGRIIESVPSRPSDEFFTDGSVEDEEDNLPDLVSWTQGIADGGPFDVRSCAGAVRGRGAGPSGDSGGRRLHVGGHRRPHHSSEGGWAHPVDIWVTLRGGFHRGKASSDTPM